MADAKRMNEWDQTASIMTIVVNMFASKDSRVSFEQLHPMRRQKLPPAREPVATEETGQLWDMIVGNNMPTL